MDNIFEKVQLTKPPRSFFDLTHDVKASFNFGNLYPMMSLMCMPGDRINVSQEAFIRALPMIAPPMHRVNIYFHTFFVPLRLLWPNWEKWATNTKVSGTLPAHPLVRSMADGSNYTPLMDYLGIPNPDLQPLSVRNMDVNAMAFAAYQRIYNDFYRDQNLIADLINGTTTSIELTDGLNTTNFTALTTMRKRAWRHDYFTSCLPFAQKGDAVSMPFNFPDVNVRRNIAGIASSTTLDSLGADPDMLIENSLSTYPTIIAEGPYAETSVLAGSSSINDLRTAEALQKWLERAARGGSRYTEWILSMYGVRSSDARLQRPEYVNGSITPLLISDVPSTAETTSAPQATLAGYGVANVQGRGSGYFCEEFGIMMSIMSCLPEAAYQQGLEKSLWLRTNDPSELPNPLFMNLGEQEVKQKEIMAYTVNSEDTFGYIPRFSEDRFQTSRVAGEMRSSLNFWHFGRIFENEPALNQAFIECDATYRPFAVNDPDEDHFVMHVLNKLKATRPLTKYANPSLI